MDIDFNAIVNSLTVIMLVAIAHWMRKFIARTNERIDSWDKSVHKIDQHLQDHQRDRKQLNRIENKVDSSNTKSE